MTELETSVRLTPEQITGAQSCFNDIGRKMFELATGNHLAYLEMIANAGTFFTGLHLAYIKPEQRQAAYLNLLMMTVMVQAETMAEQLDIKDFLGVESIETVGMGTTSLSDKKH